MSKIPIAGTEPNESIRFLHVFPGFNIGGAELRIARTINFIGPGKGHAILSINGTCQASCYLDDHLNVPIYKGPRKTSWLRFPMDLWNCIREIQPSVILTYNWGATDVLIGAKLANFRPVIHNECGMSVDVNGERWRRRLARRFLLPRCHRVVVTARTFHKKVVQQYGVDPKKTAFIKTGVDSVRFTPSTDFNLRRQIAPGVNGIVFGYIGTLRPSKNIPMLIRAFAAARKPEDRLALFGDGPDRTLLSNLATELNIDKAVYFHGHISESERAYNASDIYVTASRSEAASNSLLEAMASGLPVVSSDIADNRYILAKENHKFVYDVRDFKGYTKALKILAEDTKLRRRLGKLNRERVVSEYPLERMFSEYSTLWENASRQA